MKILFLTDNFPPEVNAPATRTYEHCKKWVELGYEVTVITCFPNFPKGKVFDGYKNSMYKSEIIEGIKVIRVWSYITENNGFIKRIIDYISYSISSFIVGLFIKTDLIIATSPQFFTAISGRLLSIFKQKKWIMEVRDLWPDSIVAVGSLSKSSMIFKTLKKIENLLYKSAYKIIVVTDSFKEYLMHSHEIEGNKIGVYKNGVISDKYINPQEDDLYELKTLLDIREKIIISYIGTHGLAHGLKFILECISKIEDSKYHFLFIGDGAEKSNLIRFSKESNIKNCTFLDSIPKKEIPKYIGISDYSLVNLKKSDEFKNVIPSKIFENIAMYKPILLGVEGESKTLIEKYKVGLAFEPENEKSFLKSLIQLNKLNDLEFKSKCDTMLIDFDRNIIAEKMIGFVTSSINS